MGPAWHPSLLSSGFEFACFTAGTDSISPSQQVQGNRGKAPAPSQP